MFQLGSGVVDDGTAALDASEGFQYRRDVIRFQLAALWQQDQLRGGIALRTDAIRERDERLNRRWDIAECRNQVALRVLDTLANRTLLGRLEQLPLPDVLQINADKIDVLATDGNASLERLFVLAFRANRLILECLRLFVVKNILGARCERLTCLFELFMGIDGEPEVLCAVPPVQDMRLLRRIVPVDQRLSAPGRRELERFRTSARSLWHVVLGANLLPFKTAPLTQEFQEPRRRVGCHTAADIVNPLRLAAPHSSAP